MLALASVLGFEFLLDFSLTKILVISLAANYSPNSISEHAILMVG